jgi:hypothetical protein
VKERRKEKKDRQERKQQQQREKGKRETIKEMTRGKKWCSNF